MLLGDILICVCNYGFDGSLCECCLFQFIGFECEKCVINYIGWIVGCDVYCVYGNGIG